MERTLDNDDQKGLCYRYGLTGHTDAQYTASEYRDKCLADLETAGLIHRGSCLQPGDQGCMDRAITPKMGRLLARARLTNCVLDQPEAGIQERRRTAETDDDRNWRIVAPR